VLKRFDATKLYTLACQDVVERFHLLLVLAFVVVEEMGNRCAGSRTRAARACLPAWRRAGPGCGASIPLATPGLPVGSPFAPPAPPPITPPPHTTTNSGSRSPNPVLLAGCARIYAGEVVIDVIKHAVLGKFNEIRWVLALLPAPCMPCTLEPLHPPPAHPATLASPTTLTPSPHICTPAFAPPHPPPSPPQAGRVPRIHA
jgi:hypothetical protein